MSVAAAAVDRLIGSVGLIWHTSRKAVASDEIPAIFKGLMDGTAPVKLWVSSLALPSGSKGSATRGFYGLLGAELAILSPEMTSDQASDVALELAAEIIRGGEAPAHGEKLQYGDGKRFRVEHRAIGVDGGVPIVVLTQLTDADMDQSADESVNRAASEEDSEIPEVPEAAPAESEPEAPSAIDGGEAEESAVSGDEDPGDEPGSVAAARAV